MSKFTPFRNESQTASIGGLSFENRTDRISVSGDVDLTRDKTGLERARKLRDLLASVVAELEGEAGLPEAVQVDPAAVTGKRDPFA